MKFFKKKHIVYKKVNCNKIDKILHGRIGIFFVDTGTLTFIQYKAMIFFFKKRLKKIMPLKFFLRVTNTLKKTKKSIGVRMGKGKGGLDDFYMPVHKGQLMIEFCFDSTSDTLNHMFIKKCYNIVKYLGMKSPIKLRLIIK